MLVYYLPERFSDIWDRTWGDREFSWRRSLDPNVLSPGGEVMLVSYSCESLDGMVESQEFSHWGSFHSVTLVKKK
jgi:hypothetical protein